MVIILIRYEKSVLKVNAIQQLKSLHVNSSRSSIENILCLIIDIYTILDELSVSHSTLL